MYHCIISIPLGTMVLRARETEVQFDLGKFDTNTLFDIGLRQVCRRWHQMTYSPEQVLLRTLFGNVAIESLSVEQLLAYERLLGILNEFIYLVDRQVPTFLNVSIRHVGLTTVHILPDFMYIGVTINVVSSI